MMMILLILIKCATVLCSQLTAEQAAECDGHILNMLHNASQGSGKLMIETVHSYIALIKSITEKILLKDISYLACKKLFDQGTAQFLFYEIDTKKDEIKSRFNWSDVELTRLKSLIDNAMDVWITFLDVYFHEYGGEIEEQKVPREQLKVNDSAFEECNKVYREGMAPFLLYDVHDEKVAKMKKKFKWGDEQVNNFKLLMTNADSEWMKFLKIWFTYVKKLPTTTERYNYFSPTKFEVFDDI